MSNHKVVYLKECETFSLAERLKATEDLNFHDRGDHNEKDISNWWNNFRK